MGNPPLASLQAAEASLPPISKSTVFVVVSKGVPEAQGDADIIYHISGAFQNLWGRQNAINSKARVLGVPAWQLRVVPAHPQGSWQHDEWRGGGSTAPCVPHNTFIWCRLHRLSNKGILQADHEERDSKRAAGHGCGKYPSGSLPCFQLHLQITCLEASDLLVSASRFFLSLSSHLSKPPPQPTS